MANIIPTPEEIARARLQAIEKKASARCESVRTAGKSAAAWPVKRQSAQDSVWQCYLLQRLGGTFGDTAR